MEQRPLGERCVLGFGSTSGPPMLPTAYNTLNYSFTVEDPNTWESAWSGEFPWPTAGGRVYEYACHEGNYAMGNIMRGARLLEADAAGAATGGE